MNKQEVINYLNNRGVYADVSIEEMAEVLAVNPRPKGEWTDLSTDGRHTGWITCSVCGQEPPNESNLRTNFCPYCGADMRKEVAV